MISIFQGIHKVRFHQHITVDSLKLEPSLTCSNFCTWQVKKSSELQFDTLNIFQTTMYYLSLLFFVKLNTMFSHVLINQGLFRIPSLKYKYTSCCPWSEVSWYLHSSPLPFPYSMLIRHQRSKNSSFTTQNSLATVW